MPEPDGLPTPFDEFLDRFLRGDAIDVDDFLRLHPGLSRSEIDQVRQLAGKADEVPSSVSTAGAAGIGGAPDAPPVERVGPYRLGRRIGAGGMGAVFLADDEALGRQIAVKIIGPDLVGHGERAERFLREIRAVARLNHPNIVTVHATGEHDGVRYMAMEYVPGASLHEVLANAATHGTRPAVSDVVRIGTEIARALQSAHEAGIIHRDVKPSNIRIAEDERAVLLDFGLARDATDATLTEASGFLGSPQYASPEQVSADRGAVDVRTDVYSLGATLYEALAGSAPFRAETREQLFNQILTREPVPLRKLAPNVPRDLETVVHAAMEKDPGRRHQTAKAFADDLEAVREGRPVSVRPPSALGRLARWSKRQPAKAALAMAMIIGIPLVAALLGFIVANRDKIALATAHQNAAELARQLEGAFLELGEGDAERAQKMFEQTLAAFPTSAEATAGIALSLVEQRVATRVLAYLDTLAPRPDSWPGRVRVEALERLGKPAEARALEATLPPPSSSIDHFVNGMLCLSRYHRGVLRAAPEAYDALSRAVLAAPVATALYHYELGHAAWHADRHKDAKAIVSSIEHLWPESPERWFAVGRTLLSADRSMAFQALERAAQNPPRSRAARTFIAKHLSNTKLSKETRERALTLARETVAADPDEAKSHWVLGVALIANDQADDAIEALLTALRLAPHLPEPNHTLAKVLIKRNDYEGALPLAEEAVRGEPSRGSSWNLLGIANLNTARVEESIRNFEKATELDPEDPDARFNLGCACIKAGNFERALAEGRKAAELASSSLSQRQTKQLVTQAKHLTEIEQRLKDVKAGGDPPTPAERLLFAREILTPKKQFFEASERYIEAFDIDATLLTEREPYRAFEASRAAAAAAFGKGVDPPADPSARARLLAKARGWFELEVIAAEQEIERTSTQRPFVVARMKMWASDPYLAAARDVPADLSADADRWRDLWKRCDAITGTTPETRPVVSR